MSLTSDCRGAQISSAMKESSSQLYNMSFCALFFQKLAEHLLLTLLVSFLYDFLRGEKRGRRKGFVRDDIFLPECFIKKNSIMDNNASNNLESFQIKE